MAPQGVIQRQDVQKAAEQDGLVRGGLVFQQDVDEPLTWLPTWSLWAGDPPDHIRFPALESWREMPTIHQFQIPGLQVPDKVQIHKAFKELQEDVPVPEQPAIGAVVVALCEASVQAWNQTPLFFYILKSRFNQTRANTVRILFEMAA